MMDSSLSADEFFINQLMVNGFILISFLHKTYDLCLTFMGLW